MAVSWEYDFSSSQKDTPYGGKGKLKGLHHDFHHKIKKDYFQKY
jgi:hypothetical protein